MQRAHSARSSGTAAQEVPAAPRGERPQDRGFPVAAGIFFGLGLGGFVDGICCTSYCSGTTC